MKPTALLSALFLLAAFAPALGDDAATAAPPPTDPIDVASAPPRPRPAPPKTGTQKPAAKITDVKIKSGEETRQSTNTPVGVRIKDLADIQGARGNQLTGFGLVVGLEGTGDGQTSAFTVQSVINMLRNFGITVSVSPQQLQVKNVAAVIVTADLPPFATKGSKIDVTVSALGDAKSLQGGMLLQTPLRGADGNIYAAAQGAVSIGGFNFGAGGASIQKNFVNVGRVPRGAFVEDTVPTTVVEDGRLTLALREPDFTTASRVAEAVRKAGYSAQANDATSVTVGVPPEFENDHIGFIARVEALTAVPDTSARIVINERTGTVAIGANVKLSEGGITHGAISVKIENTPIVVPPAPFNPNPGQVVPQQDVRVQEEPKKLARIPNTATVDQLVRALNALGVTPRELISILQSMRSAGMISATIELQ